eukprot:13221362-Alexandrium_andersonii.AAC.1
MSAAPAPAGFSAPHFRHASLRANWRSLQDGHTQSPGLIPWPLPQPGRRSGRHRHRIAAPAPRLS